MKTCITCLEEKPLSEYSKNGSYKGRQKFKSHCKRCEYSNRLNRFMDIVEDIFGDLSCLKCGYDKCFAALDFHHIDESTKELQPSKLLYHKEKTIRDELGSVLSFVQIVIGNIITVNSPMKSGKQEY